MLISIESWLKAKKRDSSDDGADHIFLQKNSSRNFICVKSKVVVVSNEIGQSTYSVPSNAKQQDIESLDTLATPATIGELRGVLAEQQSLGKSASHGKRAIKVLADLLDQPHETAMRSITQLADRQGVHASTLTRLARNLGYAGFGEFQSVFKNHVSGNEHFYTRQANDLLHADINASGKCKTRQIMERVTNNEIENIRRVQQDIDIEQLEQATQLIINAPRVRTHGLRVSHSTASYLSYGLGWLRNDVSMLDAANHGIAHSLAQMSENDVLIAVGCLPYTRSTVEAAAMAANHGVKVVALTDSHSSQLGSVSDFALIAPTRGAYVSNSIGAMHALAETVVAMVAQAMGEDALSAIQRREDFINEEKIEL